MSHIKFKDVAHLYLGCQCEFKPRRTSVRVGEFGIIAFQRLQAGMHVKPILRPLSDMTEEEMEECGNLTYDFRGNPELNKWEWHYFEIGLDAQQFLWLLQRHFDLFGLIESGEAISQTKQ